MAFSELPRFRTPVVGLGLGAACFIAYANSVRVPFLFDDVQAIVDNRQVTRLWPIGEAMRAPPQTTVAGRPIVSLTLAINHAISGFEVWSYHALNVLVHGCNSLLLFAIIRRILRAPRLSRTWGSIADGAALGTALLWTLHPLQTMCVTYVVQRAESLMGLSLLLTLYCSLRAHASARFTTWGAAAVGACAVGMGCKEVMVVAPVLVAVFDRVLFCASVREQLRGRWRLYVGLAATWVILVLLMLPGPRSESVGLGLKDVRPLEYLRTQPEVILHYLRMVVWPHPLCLDYEWPIARSVARIAMSAIVVGVGVVLTGWGLYRRRTASLPAAWFFLILSPTSSLVPISIVASEHRMYLPLAVPCLMATIGLVSLTERLAGTRRFRWVSGAAIAGLAVILVRLTIRRNQSYQSGIDMWRDVVAQRPNNPRGHCNLGVALLAAGRRREATEEFRTALRLMPTFVDASYNLGMALAAQSRFDEAVEQFRASVRLDPRRVERWFNLGRALRLRGSPSEAIPCLRRVRELRPDYPRVEAELGIALALSGRVDEAIAPLREAVERHEESAEPMNVLAWILSTHPDGSRRDGVEALRLASIACRQLGDRDAGALDTLAAAYAETGQFDLAVSTAKRALEVAGAAGTAGLVDEIQERIRLYQQGRAYREKPTVATQAGE